MYKVTSEIYGETNFEPQQGNDGKVVSKFKFYYPTDFGAQQETALTLPAKDKDGDLVVTRRPARCAQIEIEHLEATELQLVGLQVWRGALLLADFIFHNRQEFCDKQILELGAGVGLTSIAAALFVKRVICSDIDIGGILNLIRANVERNRKHFDANANVQVLEYNFMQQPEEYSKALKCAIEESDVIFAADVIYDDELTNAFIKVIDYIFAMSNGRSKMMYVALEKRYVFTLAEMDSGAPMFEYFLKQIKNKCWRYEYISIDFPQYFEYERCKELILLKLSKH